MFKMRLLNLYSNTRTCIPATTKTNRNFQLKFELCYNLVSYIIAELSKM